MCVLENGGREEVDDLRKVDKAMETNGPSSEKEDENVKDEESSKNNGGVDKV